MHSTADIVKLLREKYYHPSAATPMSSASGMRLVELRESYPQAREAVEELLNEQPLENRQILVLRGKRDGAIKHVFWNPIQGEAVKPIDEEFKELWHNLKVPNVVDLSHDLENGACCVLTYRGPQRYSHGRNSPCQYCVLRSGAAWEEGPTRHGATQVQAPEHAFEGRRLEQRLCQAQLIILSMDVIHYS